MSTTTTPKEFVVTVSSRALFNMEADHKVFEQQGLAAYIQYEEIHKNEPFEGGPAMRIVKKLAELKKMAQAGVPNIKLVLLSRNSAMSSARIFTSLKHHHLDIASVVFTDGSNTSQFVKPLLVDLFLSSNPKQVTLATKAGVGAACVMPMDNVPDGELDELRVAFDGDAVVFDGSSEAIARHQGLSVFKQVEAEKWDVPMAPGPLRPFLELLQNIQQAFPPEQCPIRTALVTARDTYSGERALNTLKSWGVRVDEAYLLDGGRKGPLLKAFGADLFFDDSPTNIMSALEMGIPSAQVATELDTPVIPGDIVETVELPSP